MENRFYPGDIFGLTHIALPLAGATIIDRLMMGQYLEPPTSYIIDPQTRAEAGAKPTPTQAIQILRSTRPEEPDVRPVRPQPETNHAFASSWWQYAPEPTHDQLPDPSLGISNPWDDGGLSDDLAQAAERRSAQSIGTGGGGNAASSALADSPSSGGFSPAISSNGGALPKPRFSLSDENAVREGALDGFAMQPRPMAKADAPAPSAAGSFSSAPPTELLAESPMEHSFAQGEGELAVDISAEPALVPPTAMPEFGKLAVRFEPNRGQTDESVQFLAHGQGYGMFFRPNEAVIALNHPPIEVEGDGQGEVQGGEPLFRRDVVSMQLVGANEAATIRGREQFTSHSNYFRGSDREGWVTDVPHFAQVQYQDVYQGINLVYHGDDQNHVQFDFAVKPGADVGQIRLSFDGIKSSRTDQDGNLVLSLDSGELTLSKPVVYQEDAQRNRQVVSGQFRLFESGDVGFDVGEYDRSRVLVVDPTLVFGSYFGGSGADVIRAVATDRANNIYVTGTTASSDLPVTTPWPFQGANDAFVAKFSSDGNLLYASYLGGYESSVTESGQALAVDSAGFVYVAGKTDAISFPVTGGAYQTGYTSGSEAFISKLSPAGFLVHSTFLGHSGDDEATGIALGTGTSYPGEIIVTGTTSSAGFPVASAFQGSYGGGASDAFATAFSPTLGSLNYSTFLGGNQDDMGAGIAVSPTSGSIYVTGTTGSANFPVTFGAWDTSHGGGTYDAFAAQFLANHSAPAITFIGGNGADYGYGVALNAFPFPVFVGSTASNNLATSIGAYQFAYQGSTDGYVFRLGESLNLRMWGTYLGGTGGADVARSVSLDWQNRVYITGDTASVDLPTPPNPPVYEGFPILAANYGTHGGGTTDSFITALDGALGQSLVYSTYLGGDGDDVGYGVAVDMNFNPIAVGSTTSTDFPTAAAFQDSYDANTDGFIARLDPLPPPIFTAISTDSDTVGDFVTTDQTLTISGTATSGATVIVSRTGVGVIGTTTATGGNWSIDYTGTTLPEGTHAFTARATLGVFRSRATDPFLVTVDLTSAALTLDVTSGAYDLTPQVRVVAADRNNLPDGTTVYLDVDLNNNGSFVDGGETGYASSTLADGYAIFQPSSTIAVSTVKMRARALDLAGTSSTSTTKTVVIASAPNTWSVTGTQRNASAVEGDAFSQTGNVQVVHAIDLDQSPGSSASGNLAWAYNSNQVSSQPIITVTIPSDNAVAVPDQIKAQIAWNGGAPQTEQTYSTSGLVAGEDWTIAQQVNSAVTTTGRYDWAMTVTMDYSASADIVRTISGTAFVIAEDSSPYGAGWTLAGVNRLHSISASGGNPAGKLMQFGSGGWRFFSGTGPTYTSPADDPGTLVQNGGGDFTYTAVTGEKWNFNSGGLQTSMVSADGLTTITYAYTDGDSDGASDDVTTVTSTDGGLATFTYATNKIQKIDAPGSRTTSFTLSSGDLTQIEDPDNRTHTFAYSASTHRMTGQTQGVLNDTWTYANGAVATAKSGTDDPYTISPSAVRGLSSVVAGKPEAIVTDANSNVTRMTLDDQGRLTKVIAADGGGWEYGRNASGFLTTLTDPFGQITSYSVDGAGFVTQVQAADGALTTYAYESTRHRMTLMIDELGNLTTWTYTGGGSVGNGQERQERGDELHLRQRPHGDGEGRPKPGHDLPIRRQSKIDDDYRCLGGSDDPGVFGGRRPHHRHRSVEPPGDGGLRQDGPADLLHRPDQRDLVAKL